MEITAETSAGCKLCPHHQRILRAEDNRRLIRQGVLTLPCVHCDLPVAITKVRDGKGAICPSCRTKTEREREPKAYKAARWNRREVSRALGRRRA